MLKFSVTADADIGVDGAEETDGVAVTSRALPGYPRGLLVVQDGFNRMPNETQNFKAVDWRRVEALIPAD